MPTEGASLSVVRYGSSTGPAVRLTKEPGSLLGQLRQVPLTTDARTNRTDTAYGGGESSGHAGLLLAVLSVTVLVAAAVAVRNRSRR